MEIKVELNNLRTAPRKVRMVVDMVRGKKAAQAQTILSFTINKSAANVLKLLNSAIASATHDYKLDESNLFVSRIFVDEGPKLKRWHPMSRGRAFPIQKKTSHITLVLGELNPTEDKKEKTEIKQPLNTIVSTEAKKEKKQVKKETKVTKAKKVRTKK